MSLFKKSARKKGFELFGIAVKLLTVPRNIFSSYLITLNISGHSRLMIAAVFLCLAEREEEMVVVSKLAGAVVK